MAFPTTARTFDITHLDKSNAGVMIMPAGKSGHFELGRLNGQGKPTFILFEGGDPEKWDLMIGEVTGIAYSLTELEHLLEENHLR